MPEETLVPSHPMTSTVSCLSYNIAEHYYQQLHLLEPGLKYEEHTTINKRNNFRLERICGSL